MGLETGVTYIDDLVATNPLGSDNKSQGDDHLRNIKTALQGSFPSLGSAAVTASAADLNKIASASIASNFVLSFAGRQGTVTPAAGDYDINDLGDVDTATSPPADGQALVWNNTGSEWEPANVAPLAGSARYDDIAGFVTNSAYFTNGVNGIPAALGTVKNDGTLGIGWEFEAATDVLVTVSWAATVTFDGSQPETELAIGLNGTASIPAYSSATCLARARSGVSGSGDYMGVQLTASVVIGAGDTINLYRANTSGSNAGEVATISVQRVTP